MDPWGLDVSPLGGISRTPPLAPLPPLGDPIDTDTPWPTTPAIDTKGPKPQDRVKDASGTTTQPGVESAKGGAKEDDGDGAKKGGKKGKGQDIKQVDDVGKKFGMDPEMRSEFGRFIEEIKGGSDLTFQELIEAAEEFLGL